MKKTVKNLIAKIMIVTFLVSLMVTNVSAYNIGDVINYAQPTNIVASINGYQIMSYNVDGYTYIVAEDLRHYGFNVDYNNDTRSLFINKNTDAASIAPHFTNANFWDIGSNKTKKDILYTDIATYVGGTLVTGYNINGATIICFDELARFGEVAYNNDRREISLNISSIDKNPLTVLVDYCYSQGVVADFEKSIAMSSRTAYGNHVGCKAFVRAKGDSLVFETYLSGVVLNQEQRRNEQNSLEMGADGVKSTYQQLRFTLPIFNSVSVILYDDSGDAAASLTVYLNE